MRWTVLALAVMVGLAGCGGEGDDDGGSPYVEPTEGDDEESAAQAPGPVKLTVRTTGTHPVDPGFDTDRIEVAAGATVELTLVNGDANPTVPPDLVVEGVDGAATQQISPGDETTVTFTAPMEPGEWPFYCSLGNHRELGMEGVFVVV